MPTTLSIINRVPTFHQNTNLREARRLIGNPPAFSLFDITPNRGRKIRHVSEVNLYDVLLHDAFVGIVIYFARDHNVVLNSINSDQRTEVDARHCLWLCPSSDLK